MARWSAAVLASFHQPFRIPMAVDTAMGARVFWFAVALSAITALVFGLLPARDASRIDLVHTLKGDSGASRGRFRRFRGRDVLVAAQIAHSIQLLAGAGLFLHTLANVRAADPTNDPGDAPLTRMELATLAFGSVAITAQVRP